MVCLNSNEAAQLYTLERNSFKLAIQSELNKILLPNTEIANLPTECLDITEEGLLDSSGFSHPAYLQIGEAQAVSIITLSGLINKTTFANWGNQYMDPIRNNLNSIPTRSGAPTSPYEEPLSRGISGTDLLEITLQPFIESDVDLETDSTRIRELSRIHMRSIFYITKSILQKLENGQEQEQINSAKFALYALVPIMRTLEIPVLIEALEDASFKKLDPNGYKDGVDFWNYQVRKIGSGISENEPIRFSQEEMCEHEEYLRRKIVNSTGLPMESVKVEGRQKSIFALTKKLIAGRSPRDAIAFTVSIDENRLPKSLSGNAVSGFGDYINNIITKNLTDNGTGVEIHANTFISPLERNPNYKIVDLMVDDKSWDIGLPVEVRISLESNVEDNKRDHPWYKIAMRNADSALQRSGYSTRSFYYLGDWAQYMYLVASNHNHPSVRFQETFEQMDFLIDLFRNKITLSTIRGGLTLHVDNVTPSRENLLPKARSIALTLEKFTSLIEPNIINRVSGYIIRRIVTTDVGTQEEVYYRIKIDEYAVKRIDRGLYSRNGVKFGKHGILIGNFDLQDGDTISIMIQGDDRQYREFLTINEFMELLAQPISPQNRARLETRYIPYQQEILRWKESLNSLIQDILSVGSQRKEHSTGLASIRREIRGSILAYELSRGIEVFERYLGLQTDKRVSPEIARKNRNVLFRYIKRFTPSHELRRVMNPDTFQYGKAFRYYTSKFLVQNPIAIRALAHHSSSNIYVSYESFLDLQHNKNWSLLIDYFSRWEPEFGDSILQVMREVTLHHLNYLCRVDGRDIVNIQSSLIANRHNALSQFPYSPKPIKTPKPTKEQFIKMGLPELCEKLAIPWRLWFKESEDKSLVADYLIRHRGEQLNPLIIARLLNEYKNLSIIQQFEIRQDSLSNGRSLLEMIEQSLRRDQNGSCALGKELVEEVELLIKEISQTFTIDEAPLSIVFTNGNGDFKVQRRIGYKEQRELIAPILTTSPPQ
jgi:hypothetical protein